jgi:AbrB family looped-hinge helix DNA binding protein
MVRAAKNPRGSAGTTRLQSSETGSAQHVRTKVDEGGRIVIPAEFRRALGWQPGEVVVLSLEEGEVRVVSIDESIRRVQEWVRSFVPEGHSLSEELIAERRAEAARE